MGTGQLQAWPSSDNVLEDMELFARFGLNIFLSGRIL